MHEFFNRRRTDMGIHVFGHMRQSQVKERRPTADIYVECFSGIAKSPDLKSLEIVHNMLKLDSQVEPNTRLYNALMLAYTACGEPHGALEFWDEIIHSREGPTYNSIQIALSACAVAPFGDRDARKIWERLQQFDIAVTKEIHEAYINALAGNGLMAEAKDLVTTMAATIDVQPDLMT
jgi:ubiquitin-like modifier-activating enzyme ATG7